MKLYGVTGWKNSGKTTLMTRLVETIIAQGVSVSTVKHAHHAFDVDQEGKDSWRHRQAGAREVLVSSNRRWALMHELAENGDEPTLDVLLDKLSPVDLVLVEGFKREGHPKIEAHRVATGQPLLATNDPTIRAVATDGDLEAIGVAAAQAQAFDLNDAKGLAAFVLTETGLAARGKIGGSNGRKEDTP